LAYQDNVGGESLPYSAVATSSIENIDFVDCDLGNPASWLVPGRNVIAIQLLNSSLSGSSDCFIDVSLRGLVSETDDGTDETPVVIRKEPRKYEINATWESEEITTFASDITIPACAVQPGKTYRVRCRMKDDTGRWSKWSNPVQFVAGEPIATGVLAGLRITELMYNPPAADTGVDNDEFEFIELKNVGSETLDLSGVSFTEGVAFDFAAGDVTSLGPGAFILVIKNKQAFLSRYGASLSGLIAGEYTGKLANDGEKVSLVDAWNGTIAEFTYGDGRGWPAAADGGGHSLVPLDSALSGEPQGSLNYPGNWRAGTWIAGSPGQDDPSPAATVLLNEFVANASETAGDWVELYNPTGSDVSLVDWFLSDDIDDLKKWALPAASVPAHGFLALNDIAGFGLSKDGEELFLSYLPGTAEDRIVDAVSFKAQEAGASLGRYPDGADYWFALTPTQGLPNAGPTSHVVIDELMYHPVDPNEEYIELYNPLGQPISLRDATVAWRLNGAVNYDFSAGTSIPAGGRLVVVGFDPAVETSRLTAFLLAYRPTSAGSVVQIVGPWTGNLSNQGERVALERSLPGDNPVSPIAWAIVDEVIYGDMAPWPASPDGLGDALQRISAGPESSGNDPTDWQAATPTPGR
ncbi:MAG: lamin tail domain-containing protein, partial [Solirubrobacterales bacterium]